MECEVSTVKCRAWSAEPGVWGKWRVQSVDSRNFLMVLWRVAMKKTLQKRNHVAAKQASRLGHWKLEIWKCQQIFQDTSDGILSKLYDVVWSVVKLYEVVERCGDCGEEHANEAAVSRTPEEVERIRRCSSQLGVLEHARINSKTSNTFSKHWEILFLKNNWR